MADLLVLLLVVLSIAVFVLALSLIICYARHRPGRGMARTVPMAGVVPGVPTGPPPLHTNSATGSRRRRGGDVVVDVVSVPSSSSRRTRNARRATTTVRIHTMRSNSRSLSPPRSDDETGWQTPRARTLEGRVDGMPRSGSSGGTSDEDGSGGSRKSSRSKKKGRRHQVRRGASAPAVVAASGGQVLKPVQRGGGGTSSSTSARNLSSYASSRRYDRRPRGPRGPRVPKKVTRDNTSLETLSENEPHMSSTDDTVSPGTRHHVINAADAAKDFEFDVPSKETKMMKWVRQRVKDLQKRSGWPPTHIPPRSRSRKPQPQPSSSSSDLGLGMHTFRSGNLPTMPNEGRMDPSGEVWTSDGGVSASGASSSAGLSSSPRRPPSSARPSPPGDRRGTVTAVSSIVQNALSPTGSHPTIPEIESGTEVGDDVYSSGDASDAAPRPVEED